MDPRDDYGDRDPKPRWLCRTAVELVVMSVLAMGLVLFHYVLCPLLIPGYVVD